MLSKSGNEVLTATNSAVGAGFAVAAVAFCIGAAMGQPPAAPPPKTGPAKPAAKAPPSEVAGNPVNYDEDRVGT